MLRPALYNRIKQQWEMLEMCDEASSSVIKAMGSDQLHSSPSLQEDESIESIISHNATLPNM